ncbi:MAG: ferritin-like domain-containing protein [Candidatus Acetothermia bacterium]
MIVEDLFNISFRIESAGYEYYSKLAQQFGDHRGELFSRLAGEEKDHRATFHQIYDEHKGTEQTGDSPWERQEVSKGFQHLAEMSVFPNLKDEKLPDNYEEALKLAIQVEKDSIVFYGDIQRYIPDKSAIEEIIAQEQDHLHQLLEELGTRKEGSE